MEGSRPSAVRGLLRMYLKSHVQIRLGHRTVGGQGQFEDGQPEGAIAQSEVHMNAIEVDLEARHDARDQWIAASHTEIEVDSGALAARAALHVGGVLMDQ